MMRLLPVVVVLAFASSAAAQDPPEPKRPALLVPLYITQTTLNVLDVHSTSRARSFGHREANPMLDNATGGELIAAKVAASALTIWATERLWKKHRVASVILMTGVNVALAGVVANNYQIANRTTRR